MSSVSGVDRMAPTTPSSQPQMNSEMTTTTGEIFKFWPIRRGLTMFSIVPLMSV